VVAAGGGMTREEIGRHRLALAPLAEGAELAEDASLVEPDAFSRLALALTWGALFWELALAAVFLAPLAAALRWVRHALLLAFCTLVYPVAPVAGFGWLLLAMGVSQVPDADAAWRRGYALVWLWVLATTELPWAGWLAEALNRS
jgi:hypothetical protein